MPDSIIVYRNPLEKLFWEHSGEIALYALSMFVCCFILYHLLQFINKRIFNKEIMLLVWIVAGCTLGFFLVQLIR